MIDETKFLNQDILSNLMQKMYNLESIIQNQNTLDLLKTQKSIGELLYNIYLYLNSLIIT